MVKKNKVPTGATQDDRLERVLEVSGIGLWELDLETGRIEADERSLRNMGYAPGSLETSWDTIVAIIHPDDAIRVSRITEAHLRGETDAIDYEARVRTGDGGWTWITQHARAVRDASGKPVTIRGMLRNVDAERAVQQRLAAADTQLQLLLEATDEGIVGLDRNGVCTFVNPAATRLLGMREERLLGHSFDEQVRHTKEDGTELIGHDSPIVRCLLKGQRDTGANELFWHDNGTPVAVEYSVSPVFDEGRPTGAVLVFRDVGEKRKFAQQLEHQALHDPLTGLLNRRGFEARLATLLQSARNQNREHALCYVDLDHFKLINDTCGHVAGDELLRKLPELLHPRVRRTDTVARIGGDEFAIVMEDLTDPADARQAAERVVDELARPFEILDRTVRVGVSVGVAFSPAGADDGEAMLRDADLAMYRAKDAGKSGYVFAGDPVPARRRAPDPVDA